jgi:hypothetical protein
MDSTGVLKSDLPAILFDFTVRKTASKMPALKITISKYHGFSLHMNPQPCQTYR